MYYYLFPPPVALPPCLGSVLAGALPTLWLTSCSHSGWQTLGSTSKGIGGPIRDGQMRTRERSDNGAICSPGVYYGSAGRACLCFPPESHATLPWLFILLWMWKERSGVWRAELLGVRVVAAAWIRGQTEAKLRRKGRTMGWGWTGQQVLVKHTI